MAPVKRCGEALWDNGNLVASCSQEYGVEHDHGAQNAREAIAAGLAVPIAGWTPRPALIEVSDGEIVSLRFTDDIGPPAPVKLKIEVVALGNDNTDAAGFDLSAMAAIAYDEGKHQGVHYLVPFRNTDREAATSFLHDMIEGSGFPYEVIQ